MKVLNTVGYIAPHLAAATALKILLFPGYRSTDFEVHRNWLAITHSLPLRQWYTDSTSEWTLDYPPFFAIFEWVLSQGAALVDPEMLMVRNLYYQSWQTIYFQRSTVILSEVVLLIALCLFLTASSAANRQASVAVSLSIFLSPGLLIIDHIHFQYNGFLYGILIASLALAKFDDTRLLSALLFAVLLCFKHIYLYLAPAYFAYLLRSYCLHRQHFYWVEFGKSARLGATVAATFCLAFAPFIKLGQLEQLLIRLFPFSRGLNHAYWAPNAWALYSLADRMLLAVSKTLNLSIDESALSSVTRGLVGDTSFAVLPQVSPRTCFVITLFFQTTALIKVFKKPTWHTFIGAVTLCGYASFLFGWHVHEKAVLIIVIPFSLICLTDRRHLSAFRPLAVASHVSLFPLLFTAQEFPIKTLYTLLWLTTFLFIFERICPASNTNRIFLLDRLSLLYAIAAIPCTIYGSLLHRTIFGDSLAFIPLMLFSTYSAVGVIGSWIGFMIVYFRS